MTKRNKNTNKKWAIYCAISLLLMIAAELAALLLFEINSTPNRIFMFATLVFAATTVICVANINSKPTD